MMYIKVLSALTATFLGIVFIVMVGTMPTSLAMKMDDNFTNIFKVTCLYDTDVLRSEQKHI